MCIVSWNVILPVACGGQHTTRTSCGVLKPLVTARVLVQYNEEEFGFHCVCEESCVSNVLLSGGELTQAPSVHDLDVESEVQAMESAMSQRQ